MATRVPQQFPLQGILCLCSVRLGETGRQEPVTAVAACWNSNRCGGRWGGAARRLSATRRQQARPACQPTRATGRRHRTGPTTTGSRHARGSVAAEVGGCPSVAALLRLYGVRIGRRRGGRTHVRLLHLHLPPLLLCCCCSFVAVAAAAARHRNAAATPSSPCFSEPPPSHGEERLGWLECARRAHRVPPRDAEASPRRRLGGAPSRRAGDLAGTAARRVLVFRTHFLWGFALPVSNFLRSFLVFYDLQPYHLTPNTVVLLFAFVTFCEGYLGVLPLLKLWGSFFYLKLGTSAKEEPAQCRACVAVRRSGGGTRFPAIALLESAKLWQKSYFYVRNLHPTKDYINLPAVEIRSPAGLRDNWSQQPPKCLPHAITNVLVRLQEMTDREGLKPADLLAAFVQRRVSPLQLRPHMISEMSGRRDPCRMSTKELPTVEVVRHMNYFSGSKLDEEEWHIDKEPYSPANPPLSVSVWSAFFAHAILYIRLDHPASWQRFPGQGVPAPDQQWMPDHEESGAGDPELGAAGLDDGGEDDATGGGGAGGGGDVWSCRDDDEDNKGSAAWRSREDMSRPFDAVCRTRHAQAPA
ncbi:uncharacterized protein [Triticum aestivum]|uniref:uncharacterized protein n=1 Tax=Triticum aestivum TaxID=4565 RepID=UPI001D032885|nr:uncharacterized protein LOC123077745 [Triticum aestivum]